MRGDNTTVTKTEVKKGMNRPVVSRVAHACRPHDRSVSQNQGADRGPSTTYSRVTMEQRLLQSKSTIQDLHRKVKRQRATIESARIGVELASKEIERLREKLETMRQGKEMLEAQLQNSTDALFTETDVVLASVAKRSDGRAKWLRAALHPDGLDTDLFRGVKRVRDRLLL